MVESLEWKEESQSNIDVKASIIRLLENQIESRFGQAKMLFFISPEPARSIDFLQDQINKLALASTGQTSKIDTIQFGHKNRAWGIIFQEPHLLESLIPLLFNHGSELLAIAAIRESEHTVPDKLPLILNSIMFNENTDQFQSEYTGLYFECGQLVEKL